MFFHRSFLLPALIVAGLAVPAGAVPLINEIMYHPAGVPENSSQEWVEIYNSSSTSFDLSGWRFSRGVQFVFPQGTALASGGYLVIASNRAAFQARYPSVQNVIGDWTGKLSNAGEALRLESASGQIVHEVQYADDGEWAARTRGPLSFGHRGWVWTTNADGGGPSLELRSATLFAEETGQTWASSTTAGGTPGAANSMQAANLAPLILDLQHQPAIPRSNQSIRVTARIVDETGNANATLRWRVDGTASFQSLPMIDTDADGTHDALIPPQPDRTIIEYYVQTLDSAGNSRTFPAAVVGGGQQANALFQVDNSYDPATAWVPGDRPIYRIIMTALERDELTSIQTDGGEEDSDAAMNATFISVDGTGIKTRYLAAVRNRGFGSRIGPPNNYSVSFRSDDLWSDRASIQINCRYPHAQAIGALAFHRAGIPPQEAAPIRVRVNGDDLAETNLRMYGGYVRVEPINEQWAERHFPDDGEGNIYRLDDHAPNTPGEIPGDLGSGEFRYEGTNPLAYSDTYEKSSNEDVNDWSDLMQLTDVLTNSPNAGYPQAIGQVLDLDEWLKFIATDALIGNQEGGLQSGRADDVSIYRGTVDRHFLLIPHDFDAVFGLGLNGEDPGGPGGGGNFGNPVTRSIFSYEGTQGISRFFTHPEIVPRYYASVLAQMDDWFNRATLDPLIDQVMSPWVPEARIASVKTYVDQRRANVLNQIQQNYSLTVTTNAADVDGFKQTTDGAATFAGTFNVAKTYSIRVNGLPATLFYRTSGNDAAGTWRFSATNASGFLARGLNKVAINFHDAPNGGGNILQTFTSNIFYADPAGGTIVGGNLSPSGSLAMVAPSSYLPGLPVLVRVDLRDALGNLDRTAWNRTATLSATNGVALTPSTVQVTNGIGSAMVSIGGGTGGTAQLVFPGGTSGTPNPNGPQWRMLDTGGEPAAAWKSETQFNDTGWTLGRLQAGAGDDDERTQLNNVPTGGTTRRAFYFRHVFNVANPASLTGLQIRAIVDDGAVFYLNGTEVRRDNMPGGAVTITTPASQNRAGNAESTFNTYNISAFLSALRPGENLLAVEVHNFSNATTDSNDLSFDCELIGNTAASDPGNFTLTAAVGAASAVKNVTSLGLTPPATTVSGVLSGASLNWSGVVRVTGDVTVPSGQTLTIAPGTHVLIDGTPFGGGGSAGADLIVQSGGLVNASGTASEPIHITSSVATTRWGEINTNGARTTWKFCLISRACHSPGGGHTGTGPVFRLGSGAEILVEDSVVSDSPGKTMTNSGASTITLRRSHFARCVMGPEIDSSAVTIEDSNFSEMLPAYRESGGADDEDCIYIHDSGGRPVILRRSVFANSGDDGIDCLAGSLTIEDSIIRNIFDKGLSLLQNNVTVRRTQIIDCDFGISLKTQIGDEASPYTTTLENCTIVSETHPTNQSDQSGGVFWHNVGIHVRNKYGTAPNPQLFLNVRNCIISAITPILNDYPIAGNDHPLTTVSYTCYQDLPGSNPVDPAPPGGVGNISADPQFLDGANKDFHLAAASPARDAGDPASPLDPDGSRADMGALPFGSFTIPGGEVRWSRAGSPYRVTSNAIVGPNITLRIDPGVSVLFNQNVRLTVNGRLLAQGTADSRITFSHVPGTVASGDCDPIKNGVQTGPPKWGGVRIVDSLAEENVVSYADFINAQGTDPATAENFGSLGFIRSWGRADHLTFAGTHLRMCYGRNSKMTVTYCDFPDMFLFDSVLGRIEVPADFLAAADNRMEPLKVEFPTTDPELAGQTGSAGTFPNGLPRNGHWRVYFNQFHGNRGHQDVFDADSGRWQQSGQFVLDCRYNTFHGFTGDEHIDLGGDAYIAHNRFYSGSKDQWTIDTGYANAISSGDKGAGTTILVARNIFFDLDHAINCKINTATIFEHNTLVDFHQDWQYNHTVTQDVRCAAVNLYVPNDGNAAGDGAYLAYNIFFGNVPAPDDTVSPDPPGGFPRLISWADQTIGGATTSVIRIENNFVDPAILDTALGANHPDGIFAPAWGFGNIQGNPLFTNKTARDFTLRQGSPAKGTAPGGLDFGATVSEWAYILNAPPAVTASNAANLIIGGPGLVAYKWRLDNGPWSAPIQIGAGGVMPRTGAIVRQATLPLTGLSDGGHTLEVLGQDMAGNWQDADPARTIEGTAQFAPTRVSWTVNSALLLVRINEVLVKSTTGAEAIELHNGGATDVNLTGWSMTNDPLFPSKYTFPSGVIIPAGGYITIPAAASALLLDSDGDDLYLLRNGVLADSVAFGRQIANYSIGRVGRAGDWTLTQPTFGAANRFQALGEPAALRINEWFASGNVLYEDDWIELASPSNLPVALAGLRLSDHRLADSAAHAIAPLSFIEPNGFARFFADNDPEKGATHLSFALDAEMENIALFDSAGAQIDLVFFFPQTSDLSQGRAAAGGYSFYELPTRGFANGSGDPAYATALALLRGLRITEIMFNPTGGPEFEYVELRNVGAVPLQLGGVRFVEGIEFVFPPMLLNPGREVVVVANLQQFRNRYGSNVNVAGVYTGRLDNTGEKLAIQLPPPFDANLLTFVFDDGWFSSTDGLGRSLVVVNPLLPANVWGEKNSWLPSSSDGGNPDGVTIAPPETYLTWSSLYNVPGTLSDVDRDGVPAVVEFAIGMNPTSGAEGDGASGLPLVSRGTDGVLSMHVLIPANPLAMQTHGRPGVTYNVVGSSDLATWNLIATKTTNTAWAGPGTVTVGALVGGYAPVIIRDAPGPSSRRYLRLQIILAP